jgi:hypothetical protein
MLYGQDKWRKTDRWACESWGGAVKYRESSGPHLLCIIPGRRMGPGAFACGSCSIISVEAWRLSLLPASDTLFSSWYCTKLPLEHKDTMHQYRELYYHPSTAGLHTQPLT